MALLRQIGPAAALRQAKVVCPLVVDHEDRRSTDHRHNLEEAGLEVRVPFRPVARTHHGHDRSSLVVVDLHGNHLLDRSRLAEGQSHLVQGHLAEEVRIRLYRDRSTEERRRDHENRSSPCCLANPDVSSAAAGAHLP